MASAAPESGPITVRVEVDGKPLPPSYRTSQTIVGDDGSTSVSVQTSDLYRLVLGPSIGTHTLRLTAAGAERAGVRLHLLGLTEIPCPRN